MSKLNYSFDHLARSLAYNSQDKALLLNLRGINYQNKRNILPASKNLQGFTFFTRPQLNLSKENLQTHRLLLSLVNTSPMSIGTYVRCMLDPRLMARTPGPDANSASNGRNSRTSDSIRTRYIDNKHAFIPIMTNSIMSLSGWPDVVVPTWSSKPGLYKETFTMADGSADIRNQIELSASFRNSAGEAILNMMYVWAMYTAAVFEGKVVPYPDLMAENEIDYNTRIFRILLDREGRKVVKIAASGPGIIEAVGIGAGFDFNLDTAYNESQKEIDFRIKCQGVEYQDPILLYEFNKTQEIFHPSMKSSGPTSAMTRVPQLLLSIFNYNGYPHINLKTGEFEVYVDRGIGERIAKEYADSGFAPNIEKLLKANAKSESPLPVNPEYRDINGNIYTPGDNEGISKYE